MTSVKRFAKKTISKSFDGMIIIPVSYPHLDVYKRQVLVQAYYDVKYLFTVHENVFNPPPKVKSGVIKMTRNRKEGLEGNEILFKQIVKTGFNQRRKKLSNALKPLNIPESLKNHAFMDKRAEELSVEDFINFTIEWKTAN